MLARIFGTCHHPSAMLKRHLKVQFDCQLSILQVLS